MDMRNDPQVLTKLREKNLTPVSAAEGQALASKIGAISFIECSAKTQENVKQVFDTAIKAVLFKKKPQKKSKCVLL